MSLPTTEQNDWIAWEYQRQQQVLDALDAAYAPDDEHKLYAEKVTARLLHVLVTSGGLSG